MRDIGSQLRDARRQLGLTQFQLAERVGVTTKTISAIERGLQSPSLATLQRLSKELGVEIRLVKETEDLSPAVEQMASLLKPRQRDLLVAISKAIIPVIYSFQEAGSHET